MDELELSSVLEQMLKKNEKVLVCHDGCVDCIVQAVQDLGCILVVPDEDFTWKQLLRLAFSERVTAVVGVSTVILGISKLAKAAGTPLKIRNAVITAGPADDRIENGIRLRLDCRVTTKLLEESPLPDPALSMLQRELLAWSSILDCRIIKEEYGLELEIVTFPGEQLPRLPSCARQVIRPWDPENDRPFWFQNAQKIGNFYAESH